MTIIPAPGRRMGRPAVLFLAAFACTAVLGCAATRPAPGGARVEIGVASYYSARFHRGTTASGETYSKYAMTAAHPKLPFGTKVRVTNLDNGRSVVVKINDRGPFVKGRIIDLSYAAARKLGMVRAGTAKVRVEPL